MKKINITSLLLCVAFCSSCGTNSGAFVTTSTENQALTTAADLNDEERDAQQLYDKAVSIKDKLNSSDEPYGVSAVYYATDFDFNNDSKYDHIFAYKLYYQFQFVVLDGFTYDTIINERIMMDFSPDDTLCEIYHDENGNKAERFVSSIQKTAASGIAETVQIIKNDEAHIFEAVYDKDTHEFAHAYDKYDSYDKYIDGQFKLLEDYPYVDNIIWTEYIADETKPAENTTVTSSNEIKTEFPVPLAEYNVRDYFHAETMSKGNGYIYHLGSEFLTEEQCISFWLTYHFHFMFEIETSYFFDFSSINFGERNADLYSTGFTYESVMNSLKTFMSEEIIKEITSDKCADIDGEFYCVMGAKGASVDFDDHIEFTPIEITDEKVIFQITARYANPDNPEEKSYYTYDYEMVFDGENWIMTKFELWR